MYGTGVEEGVEGVEGVEDGVRLTRCFFWYLGAAKEGFNRQRLAVTCYFVPLGQ
jgi:hypothetical protein